MEDPTPKIEIVNALDFVHSEVVGDKKLFDLDALDTLASCFHRITTSEKTLLREVPIEVLKTLILERRILVAHVRNATESALTGNIVGVVRAENRGSQWEEFCGMHVRKDLRGKELEVSIGDKPQTLPDYLFKFTKSPKRKDNPTVGTLAEHLMLAGLKQIYHGDFNPGENPQQKSGAMLVTQLRNYPMVKLAAGFGLLPVDLDEAEEDKFDPEISDVIDRSMQEDLKNMVSFGNRILMFDRFHLSGKMLRAAKRYAEIFRGNTKRRVQISRVFGRVLGDD
jgi:hypothetical protein